MYNVDAAEIVDIVDSRLWRNL